MKSVIVKVKTKPAHVKFADMKVGTLYRFVAKDDSVETGVVLCVETGASNRLVELVGEDVGLVWGNMGIDDEYDFTVFTDAVTVSNDE